MKPLIVILGPTAVGKTAVGIQLCHKVPGEIISGDSMLVYRGMDIGTAKPAYEERQGVQHHLIDILSPNATYNVMDFQYQANTLITEIQQRGHIPILLGGTGLYVRSIVEGYQFSQATADIELREELQREAETEGNQYVWERLRKVDPVTAERLHPNDMRRIIRALEVYYSTGSPLSSQYTASHTSPYDHVIIGLTMPRELLYSRINLRVDMMIAQGLEQEVKSLLEQGYDPSSPAMQGLGYKQMVGYILGEYDLEQAVYLIKRDTRHFAKRQITLFKRIDGIRWFDVTTYSSTASLVEDIYKAIAEKVSI